MPIEIIITAANPYHITPGQGCVDTRVAKDLISMGLAYEVTPLPMPGKEDAPVTVVHEHHYPEARPATRKRGRPAPNIKN